MNRQWIYGLLFLVGLMVPMAEFLPWVRNHGFDHALFLQEMLVNRVTGFFVADVVISALVVLVMAYLERLRIRFWLLPVVVTLLAGVSAGLPLLLLLRERSRIRMASSHNHVH